jgi:dodecin
MPSASSGDGERKQYKSELTKIWHPKLLDVDGRSRVGRVCECHPRRADGGSIFAGFMRAAWPAGKREIVAQKVIDVVGVSKESFAKAAENAVQEAAKTVRGLKWARVSEFEMEMDGKNVTLYRATARIYFDIEH